MIFNARSDSEKKHWVSGEAVSLAFPLLILPLVAWELSMSSPIPFMTAALSANIIEGILGSVGHTGLIWGMIWMTPEGRNWWQESRRDGIRFKIITLALIIFIGTTALFMINNTHAIWLFFTVYTMISLHHGLTQVQGLAFAYSFQDKPSPEERALIERLHRQQKVAFKLLLAIACFYPADIVLHLGLLNSFEKKFALFVIGCLVAGWLVLSNLRLPSPQKNKMLFLARVFNVPLGVFSVFAAQSIRLFHSIEYLFVYRRMMSYSQYPELVTRRKMLTVSTVLYLLVTSFWFFTYFDTHEGAGYFYDFDHGKPWWFAIIGSLAVTRALMHFYLDRLVFRMSNPISRRWWGPLLAGQPLAVRAPNVTEPQEFFPHQDDQPRDIDFVR